MEGFRLTEMLLAADPKSAEKDINEILKVLDDGQYARGQASAVLATLAMLRPDGSRLLKNAVAKLISQFHDGNSLVRENSIRAIVSLRPEIPAESLEPLIALTHGTAQKDDQKMAAIATYGVARFAKTSPKALEELVNLMSPEQAIEIRSAAVRSLDNAGLAHPGILARLGEILAGNGVKPKASIDDRELVRRALTVVAHLGPAAAPLRLQVEQIAVENMDLSQHARSALLRIGK
jgi:hypothetical protein